MSSNSFCKSFSYKFLRVVYQVTEQKAMIIVFVGSELVVKFIFLRILNFLMEVYIGVGIPAGCGGVEVGRELGPWEGRLDRVYPSQLLTLTF
jgi:hypothetical protein